MKRAAGSDVGRSSAKRLRLDDALCDALRTSTEAFIANDPESFDHLKIEQIDAAIKIAQQNKELRKLGLDGTGCPLSADTAAALGALPVRELKFVGLAFASEAARTGSRTVTPPNVADHLATTSDVEEGTSPILATRTALTLRS